MAMGWPIAEEKPPLRHAATRIHRPKDRGTSHTGILCYARGLAEADTTGL